MTPTAKRTPRLHTRGQARIRANKTELKEQLDLALRQNEFLRQNSFLSRAGLARALGQSFGGQRDLYEVLGYNRDPVYQDYLNIYERDGIGTRVVDVISDETWRKHPVLTEARGEIPDENNPGPLQEKFEELADEIRLWSAFNEADRMCGISRFALLYLGLPGKSEEEAKPGRSAKLAYIQVCDEGSATVDESSLETDPQSPRFGLPNFYSIALNQPGTNEIRVHYSRVVHIQEGRDRTNYPRIYGVPRLKNVINRLQDLEKVIGGGSEAFWKLIYQGVVLKAMEGFTLPAKDSAEYAAMQEEWDEWEHNLRRVVRAQGLDIQELGGKPVDSREQFDVIIAYIAGSARTPQRKIIGSAQGQLASAEEDEKDWNDYVDWRRENHAEPNILRAFLKSAKTIGFFDVPDKYFVYWPPLVQATESEEADVALKIAQAINTATGGAPETAIPAEAYSSRLPRRWRYEWTPAAKREQAAEEEKARQDNQPPQNSNGQGNLDSLMADTEKLDLAQFRRALSTGGNGHIKAVFADQLNTSYGPVIIHNENENSAMVAFRIPENLRYELQQSYPFMDDETRDNLHVTLAFLGDSRSLDMEKAGRAVVEFANMAKPIKTKLQGLARFVSGGEKDPIVVTLDSPDFPDFRESLCRALDRYGIPYARDHGFIPHMTIAYIPADDPMPIDTIEPMEVNFSEVYLVDSGEWVGIELSGMGETEPAVNPAEGYE